MSGAPRLLPLIAVAIGGVLAVKALAGVQALPDLLSPAGAHAEEASGGGHRKAAEASHTPAAPPLPPQASAAAAKAPPACVKSAEELAREVGVSPGELQTLQNLQARRGQLDDREKALDTQLQLLAAAEAKVDAKLKAVNDVKAQIQALIGQADSQQQADVDRLVIVYEKMKPRDAAAVMATLDDKVRIPVAAKMKPAMLAAVLAQMPTLEAKKVTESLAERADNAHQALAAAATAPPAVPNPAAQSTDPLAPPAPKPHRRERKLVKVKLKSSIAKAVADLSPPKPAAPPAPPPAATAAAAPKAAAPVSKPAISAPAPAKTS